jgi:hypothetical protein
VDGTKISSERMKASLFENELEEHSKGAENYQESLGLARRAIKISEHRCSVLGLAPPNSDKGTSLCATF